MGDKNKKAGAIGSGIAGMMNFMPLNRE